MAIDNESSAVVYAGNGSTSQPYYITFPTLREEDFIHVSVTNPAGVITPLTEGQFSIHNIEASDPYVLLALMIPDTWTVTIERIIPFTQPLVIPEAGKLPAKSMEGGYDRGVALTQQVNRRVDTHNHDSRYLLRTELGGYVPIPSLLGAFSIAGNPAAGTGPAGSIPYGGGLAIQDGTFRVAKNPPWVRSFYFECREDGEEGSGTKTDPWDGSTVERMNARLGLLSALKMKANFYWGDGVFPIDPVRPHEVYPAVPGSYAPWYFRDGWHWYGNGPDRTIFRQVPDAHTVDDITGSRIMIRWSWIPGEHIKCGSIQDCTIDGDTHDFVAPGPHVTYTAAVDVDADKFTLRNIEFINFGGRGQEMFPIILSNNIYRSDSNPEIDPSPGDDPATRRALFVIENCTSREIYNPGGGAGILLTAGGYEAEKPLDNLYALVRNNRFTDMYICTNNFSNVDILDNYWWVGRANYAAINVDTGRNKNFRICGNRIYDSGYLFGHIGCITLGTIADVPYDICENFEVSGNYFYPRLGSVNSGVRLAGATKKITVTNNWLKRAGTLPPIGIFRDDDVYPGNGVHWWGNGQDDEEGNPTPGGLHPTWHEPYRPNSVIYCWGNRVMDDGSVPLGMEDTVLGPIKAAWDIRSGNNMYARAFVAEGATLAYGRLYVGAGAHLIDPYSAATFWNSDGTKTAIEVIEQGFGIVALNLQRIGGFPSKWDARIPAGQTFLRFGPRGYGIDGDSFELDITGGATLLTPGAALSAGILTPRQGITSRSGAGWPVAADVPVNTGCRWRNTATSQVRDVENFGGTMHYGPIYSIVPDGGSDPPHYLTPDGGDILTPDGGVVLTP